jgi:lipopolysaccharide export system protein LptA
MKTPQIRIFSRLTLLAVCSVLSVLAAGACWAEKADRNKPMNIEADSLRYDDLKQTSVFTGNVVLTKGSIIIRGGQLDVRQDPQGFQFGLVVAEPGKLAFFRQKRDGVDEFIEGEAEVIEYDGKADTIRFAKKAQLRRFKGAVLNDEMSGGVITYDNTVDVFTIDGSVAKGVPGAPPGRIRAMLTPKPETPASAAAPAVGTPLPGLKATPALPGEKK